MWQERRKFAEVPVRPVAHGDAEAAAKRGCIIVLHGLGAAKDVHLKELESLAAQGFLAVGIDNVGYSERRYPDFELRFSQNNPKFYLNFLQAVSETAAVSLLLGALTESVSPKPRSAYSGFDGRIHHL